MKFSLRDLYLITLVAAAGVWIILILSRWMEAPWRVSISAGWAIVGAVIGMVVGQFRGGVIGSLIGGFLGVLSMFGFAALIWMHVIRT